MGGGGGKGGVMLGHNELDRTDPVSSWSSQLVPPRDRHDAWAHVLSDFFLPWTVTSRPLPDVAAAVRQCRLDDCRYIDCSSNPISGQRTAGEIGRTRGEYFSLLYVVSGMEVLKFQGREILLPQDHFVLWDSDRRMEFAVARPLVKLTLVVPERQIRSLLPNAQDYVGVAVDGSRGMGRLFTDHLRALRREIWQMNTTERTALRTPTLDLLSRAYASVACRKRPSGRAETFRRIREYVLRNLTDGELTPSRIAAANRVSIRYVHRLFAGEATTAAAWIRAQRIERCKLDLSNPQLAQRSITQIAYGWGFNDVGHFGKVFRKAVGVPPGEFRRRAVALV